MTCNRLEPELLASLYMSAKERVIEAGFAEEIDWQESVSAGDFDEPTFLRESAWVVLSTGFRESTVRRHFGAVTKAFLGWTSASAILRHRELCRSKALAVFGNRRKIDAILGIADRLHAEGIDTIREKVKHRGTGFLQELPFVGPVTACHLAKNLGLPLVKPDRHLSRMAAKTGYESPDCMCREIARIVGDPLPVIDVVIWRHATILNWRGD